MRAKRLKPVACLIVAALVCAVGGREDCAGAARARRGGGRARPRPVVYLALGDSTGVGVGAEHGGYAARLYSRIERARPGSRLVNLCATAAATADLLSAQVGRVGEARPTLITVGVGANDLIRGVPAETFARNFEEIIVRLRRQTDAPVVVMNVPDMSLAPVVPAYMRDSARRHIRAFNERIEEVAERYGLPVVDLFGRSREFSSHPEFFSADGLHPSDAGYDHWADLLWPYAEKLVGGHHAHSRAAADARPGGKG
jgi:lysophospholipase L1-like esterase